MFAQGTRRSGDSSYSYSVFACALRFSRHVGFYGDSCRHFDAAFPSTFSRGTSRSFPTHRSRSDETVRTPSMDGGTCSMVWRSGRLARTGWAAMRKPSSLRAGKRSSPPFLGHGGNVGQVVRDSSVKEVVRERLKVTRERGVRKTSSSLRP